MHEDVGTPTWCVVTFAPGLMDDKEVSVGVPPAWNSQFYIAFGYAYDKNVCGVIESADEDTWEIYDYIISSSILHSN